MLRHHTRRDAHHPLQPRITSPSARSRVEWVAICIHMCDALAAFVTIRDVSCVNYGPARRPLGARTGGQTYIVEFRCVYVTSAHRAALHDTANMWNTSIYSSLTECTWYNINLYFLRYQRRWLSAHVVRSYLHDGDCCAAEESRCGLVIAKGSEQRSLIKCRASIARARAELLYAVGSDDFSVHVLYEGNPILVGV